MPTLTILAPNGAGKTTLSNQLIQTGLLPHFPLNLDMLHNEAINKLEYDSFGIDKKIARVTDSLFYNYCMQAISDEKDFCFECNLRKEQVKYVGEFEKNNYRIHLIFMSLNSIDSSIARVQIRSKSKGGNIVGVESIKRNFLEGLSNLDNHFQDFDKVIFIDNNGTSPTVQFEIRTKKVKLYCPQFPNNELREFLPNLTTFINDNQIL